MKVRFGDRIYVGCLCSKNVPMHTSATILIAFSILTLIMSIAGISTPSIFAAASALNSSEHAPNGSNHVILKAVGIGKNNATNQPQMITNISKDGIYKVQLQWRTPLTSQSSLVPKSGFGLEVRFMNGTAQSATSKNIPNKHAESGVTTLGVGTQYRVPGSIVRLMPVSSYDMTIYDSHGNILWNKTNQYVSAGVGLAQVVLPNGYKGEIHILIHNIKSNNGVTGSNLTPLSTPLSKATTDSVDFVAKVGISPLAQAQISKNSRSAISATTITNASASATVTTANNTTTIAKNATILDTFHATGTINSLGTSLLTGITPVNMSQIYILGGSWNFDVINGKLLNFKLDVLRTSIDGKQIRTYSIQRLSNVTGGIPPFNSSSLFLRNDSNTGFKGIADIAVNCKITWKSVPVEVYLINGNIVNIHINAPKTGGEFKGLPIYGIVSSITGPDNRPVRIISLPAPTPMLLSRINITSLNTTK